MVRASNEEVVCKRPLLCSNTAVSICSCSLSDANIVEDKADITWQARWCAPASS